MHAWHMHMHAHTDNRYTYIYIYNKHTTAGIYSNVHIVVAHGSPAAPLVSSIGRVGGCTKEELMMLLDERMQRGRTDGRLLFDAVTLGWCNS